MQEAAKMFEGERDFFSYTFQHKENTITVSKVDQCTIELNTIMTASFFPKKSFVMIVKGEGFKRNQIRLMMGALIDLGRSKMSLDDFKDTLNGKNKIVLEHIAPASGLILEGVDMFDK